MLDLRKDFPVYDRRPDLVYLDTTATALKPRSVLDAGRLFAERDYANIHRGAYALSEAAEIAYERSKEDVRSFIGAASVAEIVYTYNATYASNLLAQSMRRSGWVGRGDKILVSVAEHHANVVPWQILAEDVGATVEFVRIGEDYDLDFEDFSRKYDEKVKVVALAHASNVTGKIFSIEKVRPLLRDSTMLVLDASQSAPYDFLDVRALGCDFAFFTGHKMFADSGIGVLYGREELLRAMTPAFSGGGAINWVSEEGFAPAGLPYRHEPGTPHIQGAASLSAAIAYIRSIGGKDAIFAHKDALMARALERLDSFPHPIDLLGPRTARGRVGILSHVLPDVHIADAADYLGERGICVRAGHHCAEPLVRSRDLRGTIRASMGVYTSLADVDRFYDVLAEAVGTLSR